LLGVTLCKLGRTEEGIALLDRSLQLEPERLTAGVDKAVALRDAGRGDEAAAVYAQVEAALAPSGRQIRTPLAVQCYTPEIGRHEFKLIDYQYTSEVRYGAGQPAHPELSRLIGAGRGRYAEFLAQLGSSYEFFSQLPLHGSYDESQPFWLNNWFSPLDAMVLSELLRQVDPPQFVEIGSGMSTKFARLAVRNFRLQTKLTSIDPEPRNIIDELCDHVVREPLERCNQAVFEQLESGSILFLDSSHRTFQGSDVTVFFLEILPRIRPGVLVHIHDIYLPEDYPSGHLWRVWNEQYLLATALLFGGNGFDIVFPAWYVERDAELSKQRDALLRRGTLEPLSMSGTSFWMRKL
jgi:hypothetical protein